MNTQQSRVISTPMLEDLRNLVRTAYVNDDLGLRGQEDAFMETAAHITRQRIWSLKAANDFVNELVAEGSGLCVVDTHEREYLLPTVEEVDRDKTSSSFRPLNLLEMVQQLASKHVWDGLYDELTPIRKERGELE